MPMLSTSCTGPPRYGTVRYGRNVSQDATAPIFRFNSLFAPAFSACVNVFLVIAPTMDGKLFAFKRNFCFRND
jgi:hypothetical protein